MRFTKVVVCILAAMLFIGCSKDSVMKDDPNSITEFKIGKEIKTLIKGDTFFANMWNEPEITFNGESLKDTPVLYKGITIGSKLEEVMEAFRIKPGYAIVNREVDPYGDGCTDVVLEEYMDMDFFEEEKVLDADFIFGYQLKEGKWEAIPHNQLEVIYQADSGTVEASDVILYCIDICGPQMKGETVGVGEVIRYEVSYLPVTTK